jgi:hypothetical protein
VGNVALVPVIGFAFGQIGEDQGNVFVDRIFVEVLRKDELSED